MLPSKLASPSTTPPEKPHLESRVSFCAQQTPGVQFLSNNSAAVVSPTKKITLPETNSKFAREIPWLEDVFPFGMTHLQGQTVKLRGVVHVLFFGRLIGRVPAKVSLYGIFRVYL